MPDTQISEETLDIAARAVYAVSVQAIEPALGIPVCKFEELSERDLNLHRDYAKAALEAALSGHVVEWRTMDSAPLDQPVDIICQDESGEQCRFCDVTIIDREPHVFTFEDTNGKHTYWPHENGMWLTHWAPTPPLPAPPVPEMEG